MLTQSNAIVFDQPRQLGMRRLELAARQHGDVVVEIDTSGISTGTERLLWSGEMPAFPGMGYPLVPGYEAVGRVVEAVDARRLKVGDRVFVPGSNGFADARGLFGASASLVQLPEGRLVPIMDSLGSEGVLLALAATAHHAIRASGRDLPELIVGHGALGRLAARIVVALGGDAGRLGNREARGACGAKGYAVIDPEAEERTRLPPDPRRLRRFQDPRPARSPARPGRRDRPRRFLQATRFLRLPPGLHARSADEDRRRMAPGRHGGRHSR